jgi:hypothetical protein
MPILALILTLSQGAVEIRQLDSFATARECDHYMMARIHNRDFPHGSLLACLPAENLNEFVRKLFGSRA